MNWLFLPSGPALRPLLPLGGQAAPQRGAAAPRLLRWHQALATAGLGALRNSPGALTLLAPTDQAFDALLLELGMDWQAFCADLPRLRRLLLGHVLPQRLPVRALQPGQRLATLGSGLVSVERGTPGLRDANGRQATVVAGDLQAGAACLHAIDRVLLPPQRSLLELLAQQPALSEFHAALRHCGLEPLLRGSGPMTVFAPGNTGFSHLAARLGLRRQALWQDTERLRVILLQHMVSGHWPGHELPWGGSLRSAGGSRLCLAALGLLGGGDLAQPLRSGDEQLASNGVIHRIDSVLLPAFNQAAGSPAVRPRPWHG